MKDPYEVLGLTKDSDPDQLRARYEALKARYGEQRYQDGEIGNEGARLLNELESSWKIIESDIKKREASKKFGGDYGRLDNLIRAGSYDEAQDVLDSVADRDAKWHYYQSIIFYKREWLSESRAQLVIALQLDPNNQKYKESLRKLDLVMGNAGVKAEDMGRTQYGPYTDGSQYTIDDQYTTTTQTTTGTGAGNACANCMCAYCMTELCCSLMRGCH